LKFSQALEKDIPPTIPTDSHHYDLAVIDNSDQAFSTDVRVME
jgi:hypothetical protein